MHYMYVYCNDQLVFFQALGKLQYFSLKLKKVKIITKNGRRWYLNVRDVSVYYSYDCLAKTFSPLQFCDAATNGLDAAPDASQTVNMADRSLSRSVFHCRNPQVLTVTPAGGLVVWDVRTYLAANQTLHKEIFKIIPLQKVQITCLTATDR